MQSLDQRVILRALEWQRQGEPVWLCTVLHTWGSAPRVPGAMLVANAAGETCGSLSGGCIEEDFLQRLRSGAFQRASQTVRYGAGVGNDTTRLPCGGILDVLIEYLPPDEISACHLAAMHEALAGGRPLLKQLRLGECARLERCAPDVVLPQRAYDSENVLLPVGCVTTLLVAGYSPVACECVRIALMLGFQVLVCEHRAEQWRQLGEDFPHQPNLQTLQQHPARYLELQGATAGTAIVSLTHDPRIDDLTMLEAVNTAAFYLGVMGSAKNSQQRRLRLQRIGEWDEVTLSRIHAPIGLAIGSKTPPEIALAIMADVVRIKNGKL
ncbi:XdhC family protein [Paramixta manurensis]|uniref:XdhC family protein n=1 Tax=Paramixta manurensis TaxID=2740817 RepID=A0A6M8UNJ3_9GAMM|nr:XdhC family protein [Erwiniaceae bacterium PD-1]